MSEDYQAGHPTPPPELVQQWYNECPEANEASLPYVANQAARWGADQELEACCEALARELICDGKHVATDLRSMRRPKPPSLAEQALAVIENSAICDHLSIEHEAILLRALERLQELEGND